MCKICPECGRIAEYDLYYGRVCCTSCEWQSEKMKKDNNAYTFFVVKESKKVENKKQLAALCR